LTAYSVLIVIASLEPDPETLLVHVLAPSPGAAISRALETAVQHAGPWHMPEDFSPIFVTAGTLQDARQGTIAKGDGTYPLPRTL
jgi:hypothetical protein